ncbi:gonadotropin-releasing hormone receptor [Cherax quadricarinatus]|uniref:gonadotropin-releasing hormone receptor n=1 Tax=Cherax quadricarinatus TaxID=27406 RepID=UPI002379EA3D|nr:gonadotropin-releasing hormone receptor-like [Cherax quadricarinatus]
MEMNHILNSLGMMEAVTDAQMERELSISRVMDLEVTTEAPWEAEGTTETLSQTILETINLNVSGWEGGLLPQEKCDFLLEINYSLPNLTCLGHAPEFTSESQVRSIVLAVMAALSLVGNTATIVSIAREKRRSRSTVYTLIHHLSVADLFVTFACLTTESVWTFTVQWVAGNFLCKLIKYLQMFSLYLSTFILVLIGVDRFTAVRYPMKRSDTHRHCSYGIVFVWVLSGVLSIPQALVFHVVRGPFYEEFYQCVTYGLYSPAWLEQLYAVFSLVCMFVLPLFILIVTYVSTFITLHKSEKVFRNERTTLGNTCPEFNRRRLLRKAKMRALRISVVIVLAFVICWTPYYMMMIIFMFTQVEENVAAELQSGIFFFGMSNSLVNPLIYGAFHLCRCHKRKASLNLIIINRNGSNLRYRASGRNSSRSTTCRSSAAEMDTSVVNVFEDGVRYSFRRQSSRQRSSMSHRGGSLESSAGGHGPLAPPRGGSFGTSAGGHEALVPPRTGSFGASAGGHGPLRSSLRYSRRSKGLQAHPYSPKTALGSGHHEGFSPLSQGLEEEEEEEQGGTGWQQKQEQQKQQHLQHQQLCRVNSSTRSSVESWSRSDNESIIPHSKQHQQ